MRRYSNPPGTPVGLGELLEVATHRNTIETQELPTGQRQRRLRPDEVARLVDDYVRGSSVNDLIDSYRVSRTTVYAHLDRNCAERPRGAGSISAEQLRRAVELHDNGLGAKAIAHTFRVNEETVRRALRRVPPQSSRSESPSHPSCNPG
jgi:DNA invertase Pin-like site-specific DNA recombinase